jgi:hypothetical protein
LPVDGRARLETGAMAVASASNDCAGAMWKTAARSVFAMGAGFALIARGGCRKQPAPAPVQPALRVPRVQPDLRVGWLPVDRVARHPALMQRQETKGVDTESAAAAQRSQDASLLLQQQVRPRGSKRS